MRKGTTFIEIIFTIVIASILMVGTATLLNTLSMSTQRAKQLTVLSLDTRSALDQISALLYQRVPNSVIGYSRTAHTFDSIAALSGDKDILEWIGIANEATLSDDLSNFIDLQASSFSASTLVSPDSNFGNVNTILGQKFTGGSLANSAIVFAGSFDMGAGNVANFGWHGGSSSDIYGIESGSGTNLVLDSPNPPTNPAPEFIYEKFYLADSAYAVARYEDIVQTAKCITDLDITLDTNEEMNNALILFSNFRPWASQTFCADDGAGTPAGTATLLAKNVTGIRAEYINFTIRVSLDTIQGIKGSDENISVAKQKVIF